MREHSSTGGFITNVAPHGLGHHCAATAVVPSVLFLAFALTPTARAALRTAQLLQRTPLCPEPCLCLASLDAPYLRQYYYYDDSARSDL